MQFALLMIHNFSFITFGDDLRRISVYSIWRKFIITYFRKTIAIELRDRKKK